MEMLQFNTVSNNNCNTISKCAMNSLLYLEHFIKRWFSIWFYYYTWSL